MQLRNEVIDVRGVGHDPFFPSIGTPKIPGRGEPYNVVFQVLRQAKNPDWTPRFASEDEEGNPLSEPVPVMEYDAEATVAAANEYWTPERQEQFKADYPDYPRV